ITISSAMGMMGAPQIADYAASKAAAKSFHEVLETEIRYVYKTPGVKTTLVCCGKVETGMFHGVKENLPFFTPPLEPLEVVRKIIRSMEERRGRNQIMMPFYVHFVPLVSITPAWFQDLARTISGADKAMETFVGKKGFVQEKLIVEPIELDSNNGSKNSEADKDK
ncbi:hypothetical protein BX616_006178, partial [Lobosporangium transversale]